MVGLSFLLPFRKLIPSPYNWIGLLPIALGAAINIWASGHFAKIQTPIKPFERSTHLVSVGLYKYTRNPMYLGMVIILGGVGLLLGSLSPFLVIPVFIWLIQRNFIPAEEKMLEEVFGDDYLDYKSHVRRWL